MANHEFSSSPLPEPEGQEGPSGVDFERWAKEMEAAEIRFDPPSWSDTIDQRHIEEEFYLNLRTKAEQIANLNGKQRIDYFLNELKLGEQVIEFKGLNSPNQPNVISILINNMRFSISLQTDRVSTQITSWQKKGIPSGIEEIDWDKASSVDDKLFKWLAQYIKQLPDGDMTAIAMDSAGFEGIKKLIRQQHDYLGLPTLYESKQDDGIDTKIGRVKFRFTDYAADSSGNYPSNPDDPKKTTTYISVHTPAFTFDSSGGDDREESLSFLNEHGIVNTIPKDRITETHRALVLNTLDEIIAALEEQNKQST